MKFFKMKILYSIFLLLYVVHSDAQTQCGDLLALYAVKPSQAVFEKSEPGEGQVQCKATYKVKGSDANAVERFLIKHYKKGSLKFACCGWESSKPGGFQKRAIDLGVTMFANAERTDSTGKIYIEKDRNKIDYFYIVVTLYNEI